MTHKQAGSHRLTKARREHLYSEDMPFAMREAYRSLRTNLLFSIPGDNCKIVLVSGVSQRDGQNIAALNLALSLSESEQGTLLIEADLRFPTIAKKLGIPEKPGLTDYLLAKCSLDRAIYTLPGGLSVLPAGSLPPNPVSLLSSKHMRGLLEELSGQYRYILLDTPPIASVTDAVVLTDQADGVVLVVRQNMATSEDVENAVTQLRLANANILGFVMTDSATLRRGPRVFSKEIGSAQTE